MDLGIVRVRKFRIIQTDFMEWFTMAGILFVYIA